LQGWGEAFGFRAVTSVKLAIDELIGRNARERLTVVKHGLRSPSFPARPGAEPR